MTARVRSLILLAIALLLFASVIVFIVSRVMRARHERDLTFGIEQLDVLLEDGNTAEAAAMIPWLADRANTVTDALRVIKRAHRIFTTAGDAGPLANATSRLLREFPANPTLRSLAVYAHVRAGQPGVALELSDGPMDHAGPTLYAWTLLSQPDAADAAKSAERAGGQGTSEGDSSMSSDGGDLLLARLGTQSSAEDYLRAWRLTGDARYAVDASLLQVRNGDLPDAVTTSEDAGMRLIVPRLAAGLFVDAARYESAGSVLESISPQTPDTRMRLADAYLFQGVRQAAKAIYGSIVDTADAPVEALLNLGWLSEGEQRRDLVETAATRFSDSFIAARALVLVTAEPQRADLLATLDRWNGTPWEGEARLLALRVDPEPDRRGYSASLWQLVGDFPSDATYRYAAWYFATRADRDDLRILLERASTLAETGQRAWADSYRGYLAAHDGRWADAAKAYAESFHRSPAWESALDAALALFREGEQQAGFERLHDAVLLARSSGDPHRDAVFVAAARAARDDASMRSFTAEALAADPDSPEGLLLQAQANNR